VGNQKRKTPCGGFSAAWPGPSGRREIGSPHQGYRPTPRCCTLSYFFGIALLAPGVHWTRLTMNITPEADSLRLRTLVSSVRVAVMIPCYNEQDTISSVVGDFREALPAASIYVYDNNSTDQTAASAHAAGAIVHREPLQGKGNVVRRMFSDIQADVYVLVDGDSTYDAGSAAPMISRLLLENLDMVVGLRISTTSAAYRAGHSLGNMLFTKSVAGLFGNRFSDILSGYRVMSPRFVKSFPALTQGFEIETELTVHALTLLAPIAEIPTRYYARPEGSASKLRTYADGWKILREIVRLFRVERPLAFYTTIAALLSVAAIGLAIPVIGTYLQTGLVPRLPTAVLSASTMLMATLSLACGLILDNVTAARRELKRLAYLTAGQWSASRIERERTATAS